MTHRFIVQHGAVSFLEGTIKKDASGKRFFATALGDFPSHCIYRSKATAIARACRWAYDEHRKLLTSELADAPAAIRDRSYL